MPLDLDNLPPTKGGLSSTSLYRAEEQAPHVHILSHGPLGNFGSVDDEGKYNDPDREFDLASNNALEAIGLITAKMTSTAMVGAHPSSYSIHMSPDTFKALADKVSPLLFPDPTGYGDKICGVTLYKTLGVANGIVLHKAGNDIFSAKYYPELDNA